MRTTCRAAISHRRLACALVASEPLSGQAFDPGRTPLWRVPGAARGTPAFDGDTAYFLARDREVVAIDARTGEVRWRTGTGVTSVDAIFGATTAGTNLAIAGPTVVGADWDVIGFDRKTGERRWTYTAPNGDGPGLFLGQAAGDVVFTGSPGGTRLRHRHPHRHAALDHANRRQGVDLGVPAGGPPRPRRRRLLHASPIPTSAASPCSTPTRAACAGGPSFRRRASGGSTPTWRAGRSWSTTWSSARPATATSTRSISPPAPCAGRSPGSPTWSTTSRRRWAPTPTTARSCAPAG